MNASDTGRKVLAALAAGREKANRLAKERGARSVLLVAALAADDARCGRAPRGRAGRISRKLGGALGERRVKIILELLASDSDSAVDNAENEQRETRHAKRA